MANERFMMISRPLKDALYWVFVTMPLRLT